jgi:hypothetical protein
MIARDRRHRSAVTRQEVADRSVVRSSIPIQVTLDTYGHLFEGLDEAAAERLDAIFLRTPANPLRTLTRRDPLGLGL